MQLFIKEAFVLWKGEGKISVVKYRSRLYSGCVIFMAIRYHVHSFVNNSHLPSFQLVFK